MSTDLIAIGSVYKLVSPLGLIYIGSTKKTLPERLSGHKAQFRQYNKFKGKHSSSVKLFEESNNIKIELLEELKECSKIELLLLEKYYVDEQECVNKYSPITTNEEKKINHNVKFLNFLWQ